MSVPVTTRMSRRAQIALVVIALLAVAAVGYLTLVAPKRSAASELERETAAVEVQIAEYRAATPEQQAGVAVKAADVFRLAKAMPDTTDMSGVILELGEIARGTGIVFDSITPGAASAASGYQAQPTTLVFRGNFYSLSDFLYRLRTLVAVRDGRLSADGRLFSVDTITFSEDDEKRFPYVKAELTVTTFVYGAGAPAAAGSEEPAAEPAAPADSSGTTTGETPPSEPTNDAAPAATETP